MCFKFKGSNILSADQFDQGSINELFALAERMQTIASGEVTCNVLQGKLLGSCFWEESTRTRWSSEAGFQRLGGGVISMWDPKFSSMYKKKETFGDTMKVLSLYCDAIVLRHPKKGKAAEATQHSLVPIINGGDGDGEHPTQALLDCFTIKRELGRLCDFNIAFVGDLKRGRTVHSAAKIAKLFPNVHMTFVAPDKWQMPDNIVKQVEQAGCSVRLTNHFKSVAKEADIFYMVRPQNERGEDCTDANFCLNAETVLNDCKQGVAIMHPLPRNEEISTDVDDLPNAAYFRQVQNGTMVRMALYILIFGKEDKFP